MILNSNDGFAVKMIENFPITTPCVSPTIARLLTRKNKLHTQHRRLTMGYTHYFSRGTNASENKWSAFTQEVRELLFHPAISNLTCEEIDKPTNPPVINNTKVFFNGKGEDGHETFVLHRAAHRDFCKTGGIKQMDTVDSWGKGYDVAVCCVLLSAHRHLRERVTSDGDWSEEGWMRARALYAKVTSQLVTSPWPEKCCTQCGRFFARNHHSWGGREICRKCKGSGYVRVGEVTTCSTCCSKNTFRKEKPKNWCWFCSNGYKDKEKAAKAIEKRWLEITKALKNRILDAKEK
jgi:hypothetical protein